MIRDFFNIFNFFKTPESQAVRLVLMNTFLRPPILIIIIFSLILFLESLWAVSQKCHARALNIQYYQLVSQQDNLNNQWSQLLIEQGTWGSSAYIEQAAQNYLDMQFPKPQDTRIVH